MLRIDISPVAMFREISHLRLSDLWQRTNKYMTTDGDNAFAGRIFIRFELSGIRNTCLDFAFRGHQLSDDTAETFHKMLSRLHVVDDVELVEVQELLGEFLGQTTNGRLFHVVESAKVVRLNGRSVLALHWQTNCGSMKCISVFIDANGDGKAVHEIHFYTPAEFYEQSAAHFFESMRTLQWKGAELPPLQMTRRPSMTSMPRLAS